MVVTSPKLTLMATLKSCRSYMIRLRWEDDIGMLCAMETCLWLERSPPAGVEPGTARPAGQRLIY